MKKKAIGAVDIGGTKIAVGMVDDRGKVLAREQSPTDPDRYAAGIEKIAGMLRESARQAGVQISGIGIGSTGPVDPFTGKFGNVDFLPGWRGKSPVKDLTRTFKVRVALENDGDAAALAEAGWGSGRNKARLIYVTVGTGIGGGIILEGELYRGVDGAHPEVGHQVVDASGPECSCGFHGCWESWAAGPAMVALTEKDLPPEYPKEGLTAKRIFDFAKQGEPWAKKAVDREARYLGLGLANLINLYTPDAIVLSGSLMKSSGMLLDGIRQTIAEGCRFVPAKKTKITLASLGDDTNLIGAARVWHYRFGRRPTAR